MITYINNKYILVLQFQVAELLPVTYVTYEVANIIKYHNLPKTGTS